MFCESGTNLTNQWAIDITFSDSGTAAWDSADAYDAFLDSGVPEPGTILLSLAGLGGIAALRRRK